MTQTPARRGADAVGVERGPDQTSRRSPLGGTVACVMSWAGGGCDPIGLLTPDGWEEVPIVERDEDWEEDDGEYQDDD